MKKQNNKRAFMKEKYRNQFDKSGRSHRLKTSAFTLIELIVVMAVIGILVLLAAPKFLGYTQKAQNTRQIHTAKVLETALEVYLIHGGVFPDNLDAIDQALLEDKASDGKLLGIDGYVTSLDGETYYELTNEFIQKLDVKLTDRSNPNELFINALASAPNAVYSTSKGSTLIDTSAPLKEFSSGGVTEVVDEWDFFKTVPTTADKYFTVNTTGGITGFTGLTDNVEHVVIPSVINGMTIKSIELNAFKDSGIVSVQIPDNIELKSNSFYGLTLKYVRLSSASGNKSTSNQDAAFSSSTVERVDIYKSVNPDNLKSLFGAYGEPHAISVGTVNFGEGIKLISHYAFGLVPLDEVNLPSTVETITDSAFKNSGLKNIELPDSVTTIGWYSLQGNNFTTIRLPMSLVNLQLSALDSNNLTEVYIPDTLVTLSSSAFNRNGPTRSSGSAPELSLIKGKTIYLSGNTWMIRD